MSCEWWHTSLEDLDTRSCFFDDIYNFDASGMFRNEMQDLTWLEEAAGEDSRSLGVLSTGRSVVHDRRRATGARLLSDRASRDR